MRTDAVHLLEARALDNLLAHSRAMLPREAAGLLIGRRIGEFVVLSVARTSGRGNTTFSFRIEDAEIAQLADTLKGTQASIAGCFHSHVIGPPRPSSRDCACPKQAGDLWMIYSVLHRRLNLYRWDGGSFEKMRLVVLPASCCAGPA